jgi:septal ring factor EnvC (AmiA/AmiB activator)
MSSDTPRRDIIDTEMTATSDAQHLVRLHDEYGVIERELSATQSQLAAAIAERDEARRKLADSEHLHNKTIDAYEVVAKARDDALAQLAAARLDSRRIDALQSFCDRCTAAGMKAIFQWEPVDDGKPNCIRAAIDALHRAEREGIPVTITVPNNDLSDRR